MSGAPICSGHEGSWRSREQGRNNHTRTSSKMPWVGDQTFHRWPLATVDAASVEQGRALPAQCAGPPGSISSMRHEDWNATEIKPTRPEVKKQVQIPMSCGWWT